MSKKLRNKSRSILYSDTKYGDAIKKEKIGKIIVVKPGLIINYPEAITDSPKKEKKVPSPRDVLNDYLESTSVHGLQYFGKIDIKVGVCGKILWTCTILTSFVCLSLMVIQFLRRYNENPTDTYIRTFDAPIHVAPFPAVTICSSTPTSMEKRLAILEHVILPENVSREFVLDLLKYGHIITHPQRANGFKDIEKFKAFLDANKWTVSHFLKTLIPCEEMFESCWWSTQQIDCTKSIKISHGSNGLCCSYNYHLEDYIGTKLKQQRFLRSADFGRWSGLKLVVKNEMLELKENDTDDFVTTKNTDGIMVFIHHSMDFPGLNNNIYILQKKHELEIAIKPTLIRQPEGLRHRNKENQMVPLCIPEDENPLEYFPIYRDTNCYADCIVKAMIKICGCLPFTYDHIAEFYHIQRCEIDRLHCIQNNQELLDTIKDIQNENSACSCTSPCTDVIYDIFPNAISLRKIGSSKNVSTGTTLRVFMYFETFEILETLPAADITYLLASIGGIFSLFLGCSFLSLVEIVYFLYLFCRAVCSYSKVEYQTEQASNRNSGKARRRI